MYSSFSLKTGPQNLNRVSVDKNRCMNMSAYIEIHIHDRLHCAHMCTIIDNGKNARTPMHIHIHIHIRVCLNTDFFPSSYM